MALDQFGRFVRQASSEKAPELAPIEILSATYDKMTEERSILPIEEKKITGLIYWGQGTIKYVEADLVKMREFSRKNHLTEFEHIQKHIVIDLKTFFKRIEDSIAYSKDIHTRVLIKEQSVEEEALKRRKEFAKKLKQTGIS